MRRTVAALALLAAGCAGTPHVTPDPSNFELVPVILSKKCFGSSGCVITYRIEPTYNGPELPSRQRLTVTYELVGGKDAQIDSLQLTGGKLRRPHGNVIRTFSSASTLRAVVTDVF